MAGNSEGRFHFRGGGLYFSNIGRIDFNVNVLSEVWAETKFTANLISALKFNKVVSGHKIFPPVI